VPEPRVEIPAAARLAGDGVAAAVGLIRDTHLAIARRAFRLTGPPARPVQLMHDGISRLAYGSVAGGSWLTSRAAAVAVPARPAEERAEVRRRLPAVVAAVNGAWGDRLLDRRHPLALPMTIRRNRADVELSRDGLGAAYPDATGDVAVFVHGLCESDASWELSAQKHWGRPGSTPGVRLHAETGLTPVVLRYNSGRHICANGAELCALLDRLVESWPVPVERLTLVGHSMGGLVIRAAACVAAEDDAEHPWVPLTGRVVYLGSPHLGAPLEVAAARATRALRRLPETRPLGDALATRSVGIKDLRYGDVREADWASFDLDGHRPEPDECAPLLESATHYYVGATISRNPDAPVARVLGDALVPWASASGSNGRRRLPLDVDRGRHLGGLHHFDLLNHPRVYAVLRDWLVD
jgi:pimeloyl-ACP methyl ester carboxylesterase